MKKSLGVFDYIPIPPNCKSIMSRYSLHNWNSLRHFRTVAKQLSEMDIEVWRLQTYWGRYHSNNRKTKLKLTSLILKLVLRVTVLVISPSYTSSTVLMLKASQCSGFKTKFNKTNENYEKVDQNSHTAFETKLHSHKRWKKFLKEL